LAFTDEDVERKADRLPEMEEKVIELGTPFCIQADNFSTDDSTFGVGL
jgi:hypothetical protein